MQRVGLGLLGVLLVSSASAQQAPCRYQYRLGDDVPPGCQVRARPAMPVYQDWGGGFGTPASTLPRSPATQQDWRYFRGYNALYGFGR